MVLATGKETDVEDGGPGIPSRPGRGGRSVAREEMVGKMKNAGV